MYHIMLYESKEILNRSTYVQKTETFLPFDLPNRVAIAANPTVAEDFLGPFGRVVIFAF